MVCSRASRTYVFNAVCRYSKNHEIPRAKISKIPQSQKLYQNVQKANIASHLPGISVHICPNRVIKPVERVQRRETERKPLPAHPVHILTRPRLRICPEKAQKHPIKAGGKVSVRGRIGSVL